MFWLRNKKNNFSYAPLFGVLLSLSGSSLSSMTYRQPLTEEELPFLAGSHVTANKGTGLVHTAPAHGHDDFQLAMAHNIKIVCLLPKCNPLRKSNIFLAFARKRQEVNFLFHRETARK